MRWQSAVLLALFTCAAALEAQEATGGAKELFYDPDAGSVTSISPLAAPDPPRQKAEDKAPVRRSGVLVGKEGRRRVSLPKTSPARPASAPRTSTLGLSYWIELVNTSGRSGGEVTEERTFHSGERIRLHFRSNADGQIVLVQLGSSDTATVLFPDAAKRLTDSLLRADEDRVLPNREDWFRFDDHPGTDRLLVLFARTQEDLERFPLQPAMDETQVAALLAATRPIQGSKDLILETETRKTAEIGTYGVNLAGDPVVLSISLRHR